MNENVKIRTANIDDAELLAELGRETFHDAFAKNPLMSLEDLKIYIEWAFTVSQMTSELENPNAIFLIAEIEGEAVGYTKLESGVTTTGVLGKNPVKIKRIYAKQNVIGFGVGAVLMRRCLEEAEKLNHDTIWLAVWKHNEIAQRFYEKWNFEECGKIDFQLGNIIYVDKVLQRSVASDKGSYKTV